MSAASTDFDFPILCSPGPLINVECAAPVLRAIRAEVLAGFASLQHGGLEVGGVLFGRRAGGVVRILARLPLTCEHAYGPSFTVSENDEAGLRRLLDSAAVDPELRELEPVGWYHSHTRRPIGLGERDLALHRRWFPEPWQLALVLKPADGGAVRAVFFVRQPDGSMASDASGELCLAPGDAGPEDTELEERAASGEFQPEAAREEHPAVEPPPAPSAPEPRRAMRRRYVAPAIVLVLLTAAAAGWMGISRVSDGSVGLRAVEQAGQLHIYWDRNSRRLARVPKATLEIADGSALWNTSLGPEQLRKGYLVYARQSAAVVVRLRVAGEGAEPFEEATFFVGSPPASSTAPSPAGDADRLQEPEIEPVRAAVARQSAELDRLESLLSGMARQVKPKETKRNPLRLAAPESTPAPPRGSETLLAPPPSVAAASPPNPSVVENLLPPGRPPAAPPTPAVPQSGKLIWAGRLIRRGVVTIEGGRASSGSLIGALPGVPVRIIVFPADLTQDGLVLFAPTALYRGRTEPPGSANGWNRTSYIWDAKQASDIAVLEPPHASNHWSRITLRSENRPYSVIVVEWTTVP